jgi:sugar lactone lactonase YvrE
MAGSLYHSDALRELIRVYDVNEDGSVGHWRAFAATGPGSVPDGLKVAADGSVWVADAHNGRVAIFEPDGRHRRDISVPRPMVTSLCFGGDDLRDLYIVTGSWQGRARRAAPSIAYAATLRAYRCRSHGSDAIPRRPLSFMRIAPKVS